MKTTIFKVPEGVQHFPGGRGATFSRGGGSNCLFPIETYITCDFPGGGGPDHLPPPPDPHLEHQQSQESRKTIEINTPQGRLSAKSGRTPITAQKQWRSQNAEKLRRSKGDYWIKQ